jgi:hypothetical protein
MMTCRIRGGTKRFIQNLLKSDGKKLPGRLRGGWEDNSEKVNL